MRTSRRIGPRLADVFGAGGLFRLVRQRLEMLSKGLMNLGGFAKAFVAKPPCGWLVKTRDGASYRAIAP
jgi:hypothetical protein